MNCGRAVCSISQSESLIILLCSNIPSSEDEPHNVEAIMLQQIPNRESFYIFCCFQERKNHNKVMQIQDVELEQQLASNSEK